MRLNTNNWKLSIRNLTKQKRAAILNVLGLATGFAAVLFLSIYVHREFSYDNFHENAERIFKPEFEIIEADADIDLGTNLSLAQIESFRDKVPGIESITYLNYSRWDWDNGVWLEYNGNKYNLEHLAFSDPNFANVFSFKTHLGDLSKSLDDPNCLTLTKDIADKVFGNENPIGKVVQLNNKPIRIGAVLESVPNNSSINFSGLVSYRSANYFFGSAINDFSNIPFIKIRGNVSRSQISVLLSDVMRNTLPEEEIEKVNPVFSTKLIPLKKLYFSDGSSYDPIKHGSKSLTYVLLSIGIIILFLAIINYSNILLATSLKWKRDFGIQQILGASKSAERNQLFIKGLLTSVVAFMFSILILSIALPWLNKLVNYPLQMDSFVQPQAIVIALSLLSFTVLFSGLIPSVLSIKSIPLDHLKGNYLSANKRGGIWKSLVVFQLIISIALIIGSISITKQINYGLKKDLGINVKNVVTIPVWKLGNKKDAYINTISNHAQTKSNCLSTSYINTFNIWGGKLKEPGKADKSIDYNIVKTNDLFVQTLGLDLLEGRSPVANEKTILVNQSFLDFYGVTNPLESTINGFQIVGIVKDFNFNSLHHKIEPLVLWNTPNNVGLLSVFFIANTKKDVRTYMEFLRNEWTKLYSDKPFEFEFIDERLASMYKKDITLSRSIISFSVLAIFIACLGIFGLLSYIIESKIKEIGIRKVNGAQVVEILGLVNNDLVKWVVIAFVIATPIAWYAMHKWLENFAYKTTLSWWIFALAGLLALGIALLTVSWQSWKAATRNPVEALRYE